MNTIALEQKRKAIPDGIIGMLFLLFTETMFFAGLISAYVVDRSGFTVWPPVGQPRLPVEVTAVNTFILLFSAVTIYFFNKKFHSETKINFLLPLTILSGAAFLIIQGTEWVKLINFGLTTSSGIYGAFFYMIIGIHAMHVLAGLILLLYLLLLTGGKNKIITEKIKTRVTVCSMYWYFVVIVWPVLYVMVYLY
ncbi:MAG TPA: heme-copper oxidase subunit III [Bacteroidia bacterium]|nr:heme-copper oxidase subunit III [Bacteroidia bacterium]